MENRKIKQTKSHTKKTRGGLKKKHDTKSPEEAVMSMINNPKTIVSIVSYSSLKGFIFKIEIVGATDEDIEFYSLYNNSKYPVTCLILKFAVLTLPLYVNTDLPLFEIDGENISKLPMTITELKHEATTQQHVYTSTIKNSGNYICPAIAFADKLPNDECLNVLLTKNPDQNTEKILKYLQSTITRSMTYNLGLIAMELVSRDFITLDQFSIYTPSGRNAYEYAIAELLILFIECRIINCDFNMGNVLVKTDGTKCYLIDLGSGIDIDKFDKSGDNYSTTQTRTSISRWIRGKIMQEESQKVGIIERYNTFSTDGYDNDFSRIKNLEPTSIWHKDTDSYTNIFNIIKFISIFDYAHNNFKFGLLAPQMSHVLNYLYGQMWSQNRPPEWDDWIDRKDRYNGIIEKYKELITSQITQKNSVSSNAVNGMIERRSIWSYGGKMKKSRRTRKMKNNSSTDVLQ